MNKLIWSRLKSMKCPECNRPIGRNLMEATYCCSNDKCSFKKITDKRFNEIINSLYQKKPILEDEVERNQRELNNL